MSEGVVEHLAREVSERACLHGFEVIDGCNVIHDERWTIEAVRRACGELEAASFQFGFAAQRNDFDVHQEALIAKARTVRATASKTRLSVGKFDYFAYRLLGEKAMFVAVPIAAPLLPYAAATGRLPSAAVLLLLAVAGFFALDLLLRTEVKRRREAIFLDLPEAIAVLALALGRQSLRQALELAATAPARSARTHPRALSRPPRALPRRARGTRPGRARGRRADLRRFCELLAAKESPYLEFLRQQARPRRAEPLPGARRRPRLPGHARAVAPLLAVLVLLLAYGFLRFLAQTVCNQPKEVVMLNLLFSRLLEAAERIRREERGDGLVNWVVLAVGLAAAAAASWRCSSRRSRRRPEHGRLHLRLPDP